MLVRLNPALANSAKMFRIARATTTGNIMARPVQFRKGWTTKLAIIPEYSNQLDLFQKCL